MRKVVFSVFMILLSVTVYAEVITVEDWQPHAYNGWRALVRYCRDSDCTNLDVDYVLKNVLGDSDRYFENISNRFAEGNKEVEVDRAKYDKLITRIEEKMIDSSTDACRDTDKGANEFMKGYTSGQPTASYTDDYATDYCNGNTLREFYLDSNCGINYRDIDCDFKCSDGACIKVNSFNCSQYGEDFWCGNKEDFLGQCQGIGEKVALDAVCDSIGNSYCLKCSQFSSYQGECQSTVPCGPNLTCIPDPTTRNTRCCYQGQCASGGRCYNPGDMVALSDGQGAVCTISGWQYKTCSDCGQGLLNLCDYNECTGIGCKFVRGILWNSCVKDDTLSVCITGKEIRSNLPCTCGGERFIASESLGNMGSTVSSYCCNNNVCSEGCTASGQCAQKLTFLREPYIQQGEGWVGMAWYIEGEPNVVFSYGKTLQYELGRVDTKSSANLGVNYGTEILPDTKYYFRIAVNATKYYESSFMTLPSQNDECRIFGENYWCATEAEWMDECRGTGRVLPYSNCTLNGALARCVTCVSQEGDRCFQDGECASPNLCKPSGRYPENERYCCPDEECASVTSPEGRCVANGGTDTAIDGSALRCVYGDWMGPSRCESEECIYIRWKQQNTATVGDLQTVGTSCAAGYKAIAVRCDTSEWHQYRPDITFSKSGFTTDANGLSAGYCQWRTNGSTMKGTVHLTCAKAYADSDLIRDRKILESTEKVFSYDSVNLILARPPANGTHLAVNISCPSGPVKSASMNTDRQAMCSYFPATNSQTVVATYVDFYMPSGKSMRYEQDTGTACLNGVCPGQDVDATPPSCIFVEPPLYVMSMVSTADIIIRCTEDVSSIDTKSAMLQVFELPYPGLTSTVSANSATFTASSVFLNIGPNLFTFCVKNSVGLETCINNAMTVQPDALSNCQDSDQGKTYATKGELSWYGLDDRAVDWCSGNTLVEWYCDGYGYGMEKYVCPGTCSDGRCITASTTGYLLVMPYPSASTVKIDGVNVGLSPVNKTVEAGTHNVTIEKTGYKTYSTAALVNRGMSTELKPTLQQATGQVRFVTNPSGAGIYTMGESSYFYRGTSPVTLTLPAGPNQGNIQMQYYRTEEWWVNVEEGKVGNVTVNLVDCRTYGGEGYCPIDDPSSGGGI